MDEISHANVWGRITFKGLRPEGAWHVLRLERPVGWNAVGKGETIGVEFRKFAGDRSNGAF